MSDSRFGNFQGLPKIVYLELGGVPYIVGNVPKLSNQRKLNHMNRSFLHKVMIKLVMRCPEKRKTGPKTMFSHMDRQAHGHGRVPHAHGRVVRREPTMAL